MDEEKDLKDVIHEIEEENEKEALEKEKLEEAKVPESIEEVKVESPVVEVKPVVEDTKVEIISVDSKVTSDELRERKTLAEAGESLSEIKRLEQGIGLGEPFNNGLRTRKRDLRKIIGDITGVQLPEDNSVITGLEVSAKDPNGNTKSILINAGDATNPNSVRLDVTNNDTITLYTGGIGTTIFYTISILIMLLALILIYRRKKYVA